MVDHFITVEIFVIFSIMLVSLGFMFGSMFSPRIKGLKQENKFLEGQKNKLRQQLKEEDTKTGGFDLNSILENPNLMNVAQNFIKSNPDFINNLVSSFTTQDKSKDLGRLGFDGR